MSIMWSPPTREISLTRANNRDYFFTFENMNGAVTPEITGQISNQRPLFAFPEGTTFKFRAKDEYFDIKKVGVYDTTKKEVKISFLADDTLNINRDRSLYYEMDAFFPDGERYTVLMGQLKVLATQNLNA